MPSFGIIKAPGLPPAEAGDLDTGAAQGRSVGCQLDLSPPIAVPPSPPTLVSLGDRPSPLQWHPVPLGPALRGGVCRGLFSFVSTCCYSPQPLSLPQGLWLQGGRAIKMVTSEMYSHQNVLCFQNEFFSPEVNFNLGLLFCTWDCLKGVS